MRARAALVPLAGAAATILLVAGCSEAPEPDPPAAAPTRTPSVGGAAPVRHRPPTAPMNRLERQVAERLAAEVTRQGLTLQYLDCARWDGSVPSRMTCRAFLNGIVGSVRVHLEAAVEGTAVGFDATLVDGVIATRRLEETLRAQRWSVADCGDVAAYPAEVGSRVVCRVARPGERRYVVATVTDRSGAVMITDYRSASGTR